MVARVAKQAAPWLILLLLVAFAAGLLPISPSAVATGSMEPEIAPGDLAIIDKTACDRLEEGDIIQFKRDGYTVIHRIVDISQTEQGETVFTTKGDANNAPDTQAVPLEDVVGRYLFCIPKAGWPSLLIGSLFR